MTHYETALKIYNTMRDMDPFGHDPDEKENNINSILESLENNDFEYIKEFFIDCIENDFFIEESKEVLAILETL